MMKKLVFFLSLLFTLLPDESFGALAEYNIYFLNGMDNLPNDAERLRKALHDYVLADVPDNIVQSLYQNNTGAYSQMIATVRTQALPDYQREAYRRFWRCVTEPSPDKCDSTDPLAPDIKQIVISTLGNFDQTAYVQNPRLQAMVAKLRNDFASKRKSLLVAHSQGNFYANQVVNYLQSFYPEVAACVNVVGVATPATYVAKAGSYETRNDDGVINLARIWWSWGGSILPPTWNGIGVTNGDTSGHKFIQSYLGPSSLRDRIRTDVVLQTATVANSPCNFTPSPTACGVPITAGGGSGSSQYVMDIGSDIKTLTANFEAYSIPDSLSISAGGRTLASTGGLVSGFHAYSFNFDPQALGTTQVVARVTGNSDVQTRWNLCIDCNDAVSSPCPTIVPRRALTITLTQQGWQYACSAGNVQIDKTLVGPLSVGNPLNTFVTANGTSSETHEFSAPNAGCVCTQTTGCFLSADPAPIYTFTYRDSQNRSQSFSVPLAKSVLFTIR